MFTFLNKSLQSANKMVPFWIEKKETDISFHRLIRCTDISSVQKTNFTFSVMEISPNKIAYYLKEVSAFWAERPKNRNIRWKSWQKHCLNEIISAWNNDSNCRSFAAYRFEFIFKHSYSRKWNKAVCSGDLWQVPFCVIKGPLSPVAMSNWTRSKDNKVEMFCR